MKDYATDTGAAPADAAEKRIVVPGETGWLAHWNPADAVALADVPPMLDFYCDLLSFSSPQIMTDALLESINRMNLQRKSA